MTRRTRFSVAGETRPRSWRTRSTVPIETPASRAMVLMVPMAVLLASAGGGVAIDIRVFPAQSQGRDEKGA